MNQTMFIFLLSILVSCSSVIKNKRVVGQEFPQSFGVSLYGEKHSISRGSDSGFQILLIGYKQKTQFDIDRWLIGFEMTGVKVLINEIPVLNKWFPSFFREKIDAGMKKGIPDGLWKAVITVYDDAQVIKKFLGTENPNNARVLLIGPNKKVLAQFDNGFSSSSLKHILSFLPSSKYERCKGLL